MSTMEAHADGDEVLAEVAAQGHAQPTSWSKTQQLLLYGVPGTQNQPLSDAEKNALVKIRAFASSGPYAVEAAAMTDAGELWPSLEVRTINTRQILSPRCRSHTILAGERFQPQGGREDVGAHARMEIEMQAGANHVGVGSACT